MKIKKGESMFLATPSQERDFRRNIILPNISDMILEEAIKWIKQNMSPEDVFSKSDLEIWAENNNYIDVSREKE